MTEQQTEPNGAGAAPDPGRDFAAMMSSAAAAASPDLEAAPFGWTTDRKTGERRPKRAAGRPRIAPSMDELKANRAEAEASGAPAAPREPDIPPAGGRRKRATPPDEPGSQAAKDYGKAGMIAKGVNRLYRRAGKIVKAMDREIGIAIIEATKNTAEADEPDDSVGAAWEEVCRTNPRIRAFVLRCLAGGAWSQLIMAHAPILLAIILKDGIRRRLPMAKFLEAFLSDEADEADAADAAEGAGLAGLMAGMTPEDLQSIVRLAGNLTNGMAAKAA